MRMYGWEIDRLSAWRNKFRSSLTSMDAQEDAQLVKEEFEAAGEAWVKANRRVIRCISLSLLWSAYAWSVFGWEWGVGSIAVLIAGPYAMYTITTQKWSTSRANKSIAIIDTILLSAEKKNIFADAVISNTVTAIVILIIVSSFVYWGSP